MTGTSNATNLVNNDSNIIVSAPSSLSDFKTLTVMNYAGTGGTITLNTYLGDDNSPSDRLIINGGTATGQTKLAIRNAGGPGDQTTADGIPVVNAINGATTTTDAFSLAGRVRGGAYDYYLFRGGLTGDNPNDWFLRSTFLRPIFPTSPPVTTEPPELEVPPPVLPVDPPPETLAPGLYPIIGPELATYGAVMPTARQVGLLTLGTLNKRIGDTMTAAEAGGDPAGLSRSAWGRFFGQQGDNRYRAFANPRTDGTIAGLQTGLDLWRGSVIAGHRDAAGVYFAYSRANMSVDGLVTNAAATGYVLTRTGTLGLDAYSGGAYWTHYGPSGWYLDAVVQGTYYNGTASTQSVQLPTKGVGYMASLETGLPLPLPLGPRFVLEPQAQIIWQNVSFDDAHDGFGEVGLGTTSGLTGRLGVRGQWTIEDGRGTLWQPYTAVNVWQDWGGRATTTFSGVDQVPLVSETTRLEWVGGATAKISKSLSLYAEASYQFGVGETNDDFRRNAVSGDVGLRCVW